MTKALTIPIQKGHLTIRGLLTIPQKAIGIVLFAHGSGSGRLSPRNQLVAHALENAGLGTLLLDLLTDKEEKIDLYSREYRFNIPLLATRLVDATKWLHENPETAALKIGYFGASTGAAAALIAASASPYPISAIVSRGGRPDLALEVLPNIKVPTLFIVGGEDVDCIPLNERAYEKLAGMKKMTIIPGATHLFEETGALEQVAELAIDWFKNQFLRDLGDADL